MKGSRLRNILFWSVISAAFIGPGTITTASKAGAQFGFALIWTLVFSIIATIVLQEASARITIETGLNLGEQIRARYRKSFLPLFIWLVIVFGCAAYEAGNILGAVAGAGVVFPVDPRILTVVIVGAAYLILRNGEIDRIARILGIVVALMGLAFIIVALQVPMSLPKIATGAFIPSLPSGSLVLVIGLIGTTIVPYNLFLGSGISHGKTLPDMRVGLITAVVVGGLISVAILFAGTLISGEMSFDALAEALSTKLGRSTRVLFGIGLLAAGVTSAVTAPLAAAITASSIFPSWKKDSSKYRAVWMAVLAVGFMMSMLNLKPIPIIIAAQALNGVLLPIVAVVLAIILFDLVIITRKGARFVGYTMLVLVIVGVATFLGVNSLLSALGKTGLYDIADSLRITIAAVAAGVMFLWLGYRVVFNESAHIAGTVDRQ